MSSHLITSPGHSQAAEVPRAERRFDLSYWLRLIGSIGIGLASIIFMLQGLNDVADSIRNWIYPIFIACLCAAGFYVRFALQDLKGGRLLCILALVLVPVHVSQMAAWLYSWGGDGALLSAWVLTPNISPTNAISVMAGSSLLFLPVVFFGFSILVRQHRWSLTWIFLAMNIALMFPLREGLAGFLPLGLQLIILAFALLRTMANQSVFSLLEGRLAKAILFLPLCIALGRMCFYIDSLLMMSALGLKVSVALLCFAHFQVADKRSVQLLQLCAYLMFVMAAMSLAFAAQVGSWGVVLSCGLISAVGIGLAHQGARPKWLYCSSAGLFLLFANLILVSQVAGIGLWVATLVSGFYCAVACHIKSKTLLIWGGLSGAFFLIHAVQSIVITDWVNHWVWLAVGGFCAIVLASVWERYGAKLRTALQVGAAHIEAWN